MLGHHEEGTGTAVVADAAVRPGGGSAALVASARLAFVLLAEAAPTSERGRLLRHTFRQTLSLLLVEFPDAVALFATDDPGCVGIAFVDGPRLVVPLHTLDRSARAAAALRLGMPELAAQNAPWVDATPTAVSLGG